MNKIYAEKKDHQLANSDLLEMAGDKSSRPRVLKESIRRNYFSLYQALLETDMASEPHFVEAVLNKILNAHERTTPCSFLLNKLCLKASAPMQELGGLIEKVAMLKPELFAILFTSNLIPNDVSLRLIESFNLKSPSAGLYYGKEFHNDKTQSSGQNQWMLELGKRVGSGSTISNMFGMSNIIFTRQALNMNDKFSEEVAGSNVSMELCQYLINKGRKSSVGLNFQKNLNNNPYQAIKAIKELENTATPMGIGELVKLLVSKQDDPNDFKFILNRVLNLISYGQQAAKIFMKEDGMMETLWELSYATRNSIRSCVGEASAQFQASSAMESFLNFCMNHQDKHELIKMFPKSLIDDSFVDASLRESFDAGEKVEGDDESLEDEEYINMRDDFMSDKTFAKGNNWYKIGESHLKEVEAGIGSRIELGMLSALLAVLTGSGIWNAARHHNVDENELRNNLNNQEVITQLYQDYDLPDNTNQVQQTEQEPEAEAPQLSEQDLINENIIARTLYAEGKSESSEARRAIASAIVNRSNGSTASIIQTIQKPKHFSCWNSADADDWTNMKQKSGSVWDECMEIANEMVTGSFSPTGTWNHYFNPKKCDPYWAYTDKTRSAMRPYETIDNHFFMTINEW